jgi:hypothetical protein
LQDAGCGPSPVDVCHNGGSHTLREHVTKNYDVKHLIWQMNSKFRNVATGDAGACLGQGCRTGCEETEIVSNQQYLFHFVSRFLVYTSRQKGMGRSADSSGTLSWGITYFSPLSLVATSHARSTK